MISRRTFVGACTASALLASGVRAQSPPPGKPVVVGVLSMQRADRANPANVAMLQGLGELGYVEGRNLELVFPDAQGKEERLPALAADLVRRRVDMILVLGPAGLAPARNATKTIPIIMVASSADPVGDGIAASLARPGGNVTGLTYAEPDRFKKQLELLKATAGRVTRLSVLWDFDLAIYRRDWEAPLASAGRTLGIEILDPVVVHAADELPAAFATLRRHAVDAVHVATGGVLFAARARVSALALQHRLPGIAAFREFPQTGLLHELRTRSPRHQPPRRRVRRPDREGRKTRRACDRAAGQVRPGDQPDDRTDAGHRDPAPGVDARNRSHRSLKMKKVAWGVLSTAKIGSGRVLPGMKKSPWVDLRAVASRDVERARTFADAMGIPRALRLATRRCSPIPRSRRSTTRCPTTCTCR